MKKYFYSLCSIFLLTHLIACQSTKTTAPDSSGQISGTVLDTAFHGVPNATVSTSPATNQILSDSEGNFSFTDVHSGNYIITAVKSGVGEGSAEILVQGGKTATANILLVGQDSKTGSINGKVLDSNGNPFANVKITTTPATAELLTNADGLFVVTGLTPGMYTVTASKTGFPSVTKSVSVAAGNTSSIIMTFGKTNDLPSLGLVADYELDGNGNDNTGNGLDLTIQNATFGVSRKGEDHHALILDGTGQSATGVNDTKLNLASITISFWMKIPYPQVSGNDGMVFLSKYIISSANGYLFYCIGSTFLWMYGYGTPNFTFSQTDVFPRDNAWHHILGTADGSGTKLYIDGIKIANSSWPGAPGTTTQSAPFTIGRSDNITQPIGMMDDIRIYDRVLSDIEIKALANDK